MPVSGEATFRRRRWVRAAVGLAFGLVVVGSFMGWIPRHDAADRPATVERR